MPLVTTSQGNTKVNLDDSGAPRSGGGVEKRDNHDSTFGVVYANAPAREALAKEGFAKFPVGSVIVREKLARADATQPELVAVMIKRAPGFNPPGGDWEFLTADGKLTKVRDRQKKGSCLDCHSSQADRDFVFPPPPSKLEFVNPQPPKFP